MANSYNDILMEYDVRIQSAPPEKYFHFLWGYLLPTIWWYKNERDKSRPVQCVFRTCGCVMDSLTEELCNLVGIPFRIERGIHEDISLPSVRLPRWDLFLKFLSSGDALPLHRLRDLSETVLSEFDIQKREPTLRHLKDRVNRLRSYLLSEFESVSLPAELRTLEGKLLVLDRPEVPPFYMANGGAMHSGYGRSKRRITNPKECKNMLISLGYDAEIFTPALYPYAIQALVYQRASGILGIRGSEFANMHFMRPGSLAVLVDVSYFKIPSPCRAIAEIAELNYVEPETLKDDFPVIEKEQLARWMSTSKRLQL